MHHKRVVLEKKRLVTDIKRLKTHYDGFEPALKILQEKYERALKDKMLMKLARDRLKSKTQTLETTIKNMASSKESAPSGSKTKRMSTSKRMPGQVPRGVPPNPFANLEFDPPAVQNFNLSKTFKGHLNPVAGLAFHPKKPILATVSDDESWKLWASPSGDLIMSGEGHKDWVGDIQFNPSGNKLATCSGDATVKVWDFLNAKCEATFTDHSQAVWACAFHYTGDFLVSCSMDHTSKLWDLATNKCRSTFRGHVDSVNSVVFQPYTNNICTAAGDKTVSLWDIRTGLCVQTFYGHVNAVNCARFDLQGGTIASCDADGVVKFWDVRMIAESGTIDAGPHPANEVSHWLLIAQREHDTLNAWAFPKPWCILLCFLPDLKIAFDRSGTVLAVASEDGSVKCLNCAAKDKVEIVADLKGHEDAVQVCYSRYK